MQNKPVLATFCLSVLFASTLLAQTQLILPQSLDDVRALASPTANTPCQHCGIVVNVRSEQRDPGPSRSAPPPGSGLQTTPVLSSGSAVKDARKAMRPITFYKLTVRLDDGTYAFYEQDETPGVQKGDRVEVIDNRVTPRPR